MLDPVSEPFFSLDIANLTPSVSVLSFDGTEAISRPFAFELEVFSKCPDLNVKSLMYRSAWLSFAGTKVGINGQIHAACLSQQRSSAGYYRLSLGPRMGCLGHRFNQRIFQDLTVPQIITRVLKEHGIHADAHRFELNGTYAERRYCTQQDESDLQLLQRLCDEEGIHYHFQHSRRRHTLVFSDSQGGFRRGPGCLYDSAPRRTGSSTNKPGEHRVSDFEVSVAQGNEVGNRALERAHGNSTAPFLGAGLLLPLSGHPHAAWNHLWLLTEVQHQGSQLPMLDQLFAADSSAVPYRNHFRATPWEIGFRPVAPTPRPRMFGVQRARVMGPIVDQVYCDAAGRISVQFDWEHQGHGARYASCWVPVSNALAGTGNQQSLPRVGTNVVVSFIQGDPDQPIVTTHLHVDHEALAANSSGMQFARGESAPSPLDLRLHVTAFADSGSERTMEMSTGTRLTFDENTRLSFLVGSSRVQIDADCLALHSPRITFVAEPGPVAYEGDSGAVIHRDGVSSDDENLLVLLRDSHPLILLCQLPSGGSFAHCRQRSCSCRVNAGFDGREAP